MTKKTFSTPLGIALLLGGIALLLGAIFISMRRSQMMSASQNSTGSGGLIAVSASGTPIVPAQTAAESLPENTARQELGDMVVSLALNPYPPTGPQAGDFAVTLTDTSGQPISDATISLDLTMPAMHMPPNQFDLEPAAAGQYHSSGRFTMRGLWRIEVIITRSGETQSVFFDVGL